LEITAPEVRTPKNVAFGYDVWKISAGCLVKYINSIKPERPNVKN